MSDSHKSPDEWDCLLKLLPSLTAFAAKLFLQEGISAREDILPATGKSPRGLAFDAITEFIEEGMKFHSRSSASYEKDLFNFLKTAVHHDFLDLIKSHEYRRTEVIDAASSESGEGSSLLLEEIGETGFEDGFYSLESAMLARKLLPIVQDEPELKEVLEAILCFGVTKRDELADIIGVTPQEITYRKNRLRVRLASWYRTVHASRKVVPRHG
jgi:hypothetical protein